MEATKALKNKVTVIGIISVLLMVSLIGTAYAYSTSVTSSGDISGSYLSVDILKNDSAMDERVTTLLDENGKYTYSTGDKYYVHVESNKSSKAWLYGYFAVDNSTSKFSGVLINTITVTLKVDDTTSVDMTLYRDAYKDSFHTGTEFDSPITLAKNEDNGTYSKDLQITAIKVNYITGFDSMTSVNVTKSNGDTGSVTIADGKALSNLSFIFHASPQALLLTSA